MTPFKTVVVFVFLSLLGVMFIPQFAVDLEPDYSLPKLTISFSLPDAPPETVEQEATAPIENVLSQLTDIKAIYSISNYNNGLVEITFNNEANLEFKKFEVASAMRQLYPKLNGNISYPIVEQRGRESENKKVLLLYRINARIAPFQIKKIVTDIFVPTLSQVRNVKQVEVAGAEDLQVTIEYDQLKLDKHHLPISLIEQNILERFNSLFTGKLATASGQKIFSKVENSFDSIDQLKNLLIVADSVSLPLHYFAKVYFEESEPTNYFRINGQNSVALAIYADAEVNRTTLATTIKNKIAILAAQLPVGYQLQLDYDDTEFLTKEINKNYTRAALAVGILFLFVLVSYRNWRHLIILASGIIINLCLTALMAYWLKISIHLYTIAGLTISFGMMVDNAIIMLDQLDRNENNGTFKAIIGATATTIIALLLIFFLPDEEKQNLSEFAIIVSLALGCSILVAIFYIPAVYQLIFDHVVNKKRNHSIKSLRINAQIFSRYFRLIQFLARYKNTIYVLLILAFGIPVFLLPAKWEGQAWYNNTIGSELYQENIRPYTDKFLGGSLRLFVRNVYERSGYRDPEKTRLYINAALPYGNTLADMNRVIGGMESYLATIPGVEKFIALVSSGQQGSITILFDEQTENGVLPYQLKGRLIARSLDWGGVDWSIYGVGRGFSNSSGESLPNFKVEIRGHNYNELEKQATVLADELLKHRRIQKVNTNERLSWNEKPADQYVLNFNQDELGAISISAAQAANLVRQKTNPATPALYLALDQKNMPVHLKPQGGTDFSVFDVLQSSLKSHDISFSLKNNATLSKERTTNAIHKEDRQYIRQIGFDYYGSYEFGNKYLDEVLLKNKPNLPAGYTVKKISWSFSWSKAKRQYGLLLLLMVAIYLVCAVLFESLNLPFYIILVIPLSFIGLFLAFGWFDFYFDQGGYAAFVLLGGLTVNSSILIVSTFNNLKHKTNRNLVKVTAAKVKPIMLTILSTCLGLTPFLIGGQNEVFWFALAVGTIGGLVVSVMVSLVVLPFLLVGLSNHKNRDKQLK